MKDAQKLDHISLNTLNAHLKEGRFVKTQAELESLCLLFAGPNWKTELHPTSAMDGF